LVSVPVRRKQVAYGRERGLSARRACTLFSVARSALGYSSRKSVSDAKVVEHMKALSAHYPRATATGASRFSLPATAMR
jgi:putative transposase